MMGKQLLAEIRLLSYIGSLTHLQRLLNSWRRAHFAAASGAPVPAAAAMSAGYNASAVPPIVAAALCIKPRGLLTEAQDDTRFKFGDQLHPPHRLRHGPAPSL